MSDFYSPFPTLYWICGVNLACLCPETFRQVLVECPVQCDVLKELLFLSDIDGVPQEEREPLLRLWLSHCSKNSPDAFSATCHFLTFNSDPTHITQRISINLNINQELFCNTLNQLVSQINLSKYYFMDKLRPLLLKDFIDLGVLIIDRGKFRLLINLTKRLAPMQTYLFRKYMRETFRLKYFGNFFEHTILENEIKYHRRMFLKTLLLPSSTIRGIKEMREDKIDRMNFGAHCMCMGDIESGFLTFLNTTMNDFVEFFPWLRTHSNSTATLVFMRYIRGKEENFLRKFPVSSKESLFCNAMGSDNCEIIDFFRRWESPNFIHNTLKLIFNFHNSESISHETNTKLKNGDLKSMVLRDWLVPPKISTDEIDIWKQTDAWNNACNGFWSRVILSNDPHSPEQIVYFAASEALNALLKLQEGRFVCLEAPPNTLSPLSIFHKPIIRWMSRVVAFNDLKLVEKALGPIADDESIFHAFELWCDGDRQHTGFINRFAWTRERQLAVDKDKMFFENLIINLKADTAKKIAIDLGFQRRDFMRVVFSEFRKTLPAATRKHKQNNEQAETLSG